MLADTSTNAQRTYGQFEMAHTRSIRTRPAYLVRWRATLLCLTYAAIGFTPVYCYPSSLILLLLEWMRVAANLIVIWRVVDT